MRDARPNAGHFAFVELERRGQLIAMITQNIDGLHQRDDFFRLIHRLPDVRFEGEDAAGDGGMLGEL